MGENLTIDLSSTLLRVPIQDILLDLGQPRGCDFQIEPLRILSQSMALYGQQSFPLVEVVSGEEYMDFTLNKCRDVEPRIMDAFFKNVEPEKDYNLLVFGHRRRLAAQMAGYTHLWVMQLKKSLSLAERRIVQIDEDTHLPLTHAAKAEELIRLWQLSQEERTLNNQKPFTISEFSDENGIGYQTVANALWYKNLTSELKHMVETGKLNYGNAVTIAKLPTPEYQLLAASKADLSNPERVKDFVHRKLLGIWESDPDMIKGSSLESVVRSIERNQSNNQPFFFSENASVTDKKPTRDYLREVNKSFERLWKLVDLDPQFRHAAFRLIEEKSEDVIIAINDLERKVSAHTSSMSKIDDAIGKNGNGHKDSIDVVLNLIEKEGNMTHVEPPQIKIEQIPLKNIMPDPQNPRGEVTPEEIKDLAESIKREGIMTPLLLERTNEGYSCVYGHRRSHAAEVAGIDYLPAIVLENLSPKVRLQLQKFENIQVSFTPAQRAKALIEIKELLGDQDADRLVSMLGITRQTGLSALRYQDYVAPQVKFLVDHDLLPYSSALEFTKAYKIPENGIESENVTRRLNHEEQVELAYSIALSGKTRKSDVKRTIDNYISNKSQMSLFDALLDDDSGALNPYSRAYEKSAEHTAQILEQFVTSAKSWSNQLIHDVISKDKASLKYLCSLRRTLNHARQISGLGDSYYNVQYG